MELHFTRMRLLELSKSIAEGKPIAPLETDSDRCLIAGVLVYRTFLQKLCTELDSKLAGQEREAEVRRIMTRIQDAVHYCSLMANQAAIPQSDLPEEIHVEIPERELKSKLATLKELFQPSKEVRP